MGGHNGSNEVKETKYQKTLAQTAAKEWNRYQQAFVPLENRSISDVQRMGSTAERNQVAGNVNAAFNSSYGNARGNVQQNLNRAGVNPNSGKATGAMNELTQDQLAREGQAASEGNFNVTQRKAQNLQNLTAMGKGQQQQAVAGLSDIAAGAASRAKQNAVNKANEASIPAAIAGGATAYALDNPEKAKAGLSNAWKNMKSGFSEFGGQSLNANNTNPGLSLT